MSTINDQHQQFKTGDNVVLSANNYVWNIKITTRDGFYAEALGEKPYKKFVIYGIAFNIRLATDDEVKCCRRIWT